MIPDDPPFRFQGGDAVDGFPTVDGTRLEWTIQFELGEGWRDLGITFPSKDDAEASIEYINRSMKVRLRAVPKEGS